MTSVAVVGGGVVGTSSAFELARRGFEVTLYERHELAREASGRNLGFVILSGRLPDASLAVSQRGRELYDALPAVHRRRCVDDAG